MKGSDSGSQGATLRLMTPNATEGKACLGRRAGTFSMGPFQLTTFDPPSPIPAGTIALSREPKDRTRKGVTADSGSQDREARCVP